MTPVSRKRESTAERPNKPIMTPEHVKKLEEAMGEILAGRNEYAFNGLERIREPNEALELLKKANIPKNVQRMIVADDQFAEYMGHLMLSADEYTIRDTFEVLGKVRSREGLVTFLSLIVEGTAGKNTGSARIVTSEKWTMANAVIEALKVIVKAPKAVEEAFTSSVDDEFSSIESYGAIVLGAMGTYLNIEPFSERLARKDGPKWIKQVIDVLFSPRDTKDEVFAKEVAAMALQLRVGLLLRSEH